MQQGLRDKIRAVARRAGIREPDCKDLLQLIDQHYDKMEATLAGSLHTRALQYDTPVEAIFDSVTDAVISVSEDGIIRSCNKVCSRYFGVERIDLIGADIADILPDAEGQQLDHYLLPYMSDLDDANQQLRDGEVIAARSDGDTFVAEISVSKLTGQPGVVYVISLRDVTDRRNAERILRENEERYRALVEYAPEAIVVVDVDTNRFTDANEFACKLFGLNHDEMLSVGPEAVSPKQQPDGVPSFGVRRGFVDRALAGEHPTFEWTHMNSSGREIPCEVRFSRLASDERRLIRVSVTDISARKRAETLSVAQNKVLEMIASGAPHEKTLRAICRFVGQIGDGFRAAIMKLDAKRRTLSLAEAPGIPDRFRAQLESVRASKDSLTCGAAVDSGRNRFTTDIENDTGWSGAAAEANRLDVKAVWSFVVYGAGDSILGTMDVYLGECRAPSAEESSELSHMARLVGIAMKRHQDELRRRRSEARYRGLFENVIDGVYIASRDGKIVTANRALVEMLGYDSVDDLKAVGMKVLYANPIDRDRVFARLEGDGVVKNFEYRLRRKDGSQIVVLENSRAIYNRSGRLTAHEGTITDITDRKRAETRVFEEKERAQVTLQSIGDGVITTDADGNVDYVNPVAQDLSGWTLRKARDKHITEIMTIVNEHTRAPVENPVVRCLKEGRVVTLAENSILITRDGEEVPIQDSAAPIRDRIGNIIGSVMVFHDISRESRLFRQLSYQASHDTLTGLVNRTEFENNLIEALEKVHKDPEETHAVLYVDLDQFKVVNDTFGHSAGDALLRQLTELIQTSIRSTDILGRLGGDEFGVLLERCDEETALEVAESIRESIEHYRFEWQGAFSNIRCSIGIVLMTEEDEDVASVMSSADVACYSAKDMGRNQIHLYRDSDAAMRHEEMKWVSRITRAVDEDRLELYYQPIVGIEKSGRNRRSHYELLLRMRDEDGELVNPDVFIPSAERYNLMSTIDRWVIHKALSELADRGSGAKARYTLAINLSGTSLSEDRFLDYVVEELKRHELPKGAICFEITETAAISNLSRVVHFMQTLKQLGCKFSLDDFGSGLSSFTYLKNLPVDYLKIDGQFIRHVVEDSVDESMVKAIRDVGTAMGIETIAERVESRQVLEKLATLGVAFAQGYYVGRPTSVATFAPWLEEAFEQQSA